MKIHPVVLDMWVQKYTMGYDFNKINFILFADHKYSHKDIIQCIGRGTRPDGLGSNGKNLNKILKIYLPISWSGDLSQIELEEKTNFKEIKEVLKYLIQEVNFLKILYFKKKNKQNKK